MRFILRGPNYLEDKMEINACVTRLTFNIYEGNPDSSLSELTWRISALRQRSGEAHRHMTHFTSRRGTVLRADQARSGPTVWSIKDIEKREILRCELSYNKGK